MAGDLGSDRAKLYPWSNRRASRVETMSTCQCSHSAGMHSGIGGIRCQRCQQILNQKQINHRLVTEMHEDQQQVFKLIGALQVAGLDECDVCHEWSKDFLIIEDRCHCLKCLTISPEDILTEDLTQDYEGAKEKVVRYLCGRGVRIKWKGELLETYQRISA